MATVPAGARIGGGDITFGRFIAPESRRLREANGERLRGFSHRGDRVAGQRTSRERGLGCGAAPASLFAWRKILERVGDGYFHEREMPNVAR
jgi:hypothetical protein